jgi:hypothetical protein
MWLLKKLLKTPPNNSARSESRQACSRIAVRTMSGRAPPLRRARQTQEGIEAAIEDPRAVGGSEPALTAGFR